MAMACTRSSLLAASLSFFGHMTMKELVQVEGDPLGNGTLMEEYGEITPLSLLKPFPTYFCKVYTVTFKK